MKITFRALLLVSLIFLVGCSITKRKYMPGYSIEWHKKSPDISHKQTQVIHPITNKTSFSKNECKSNLRGTRQSEESTMQKGKPHISYKFQGKTFAVGSLDKCPSKQDLKGNIYTVASGNIAPEHNTLRSKGSKWNLRLCWIFCLLEFISITAVILINYINTLQIVFIILALLSFILSLVFGILARKDGNKMGLHIVIILNIVFIGIVIAAGIIGISQNGI